MTIPSWMFFGNLVSRLSNGPYGASYGLLLKLSGMLIRLGNKLIIQVLLQSAQEAWSAGKDY